jgi:NAD(P)-dependent dehydrogenase (short-subunit alcohol dehydrogenase family)
LEKNGVFKLCSQEGKVRFKDKVAIVTGSGRGIGEEIATRLAREGAKVVVNDINQTNLDGVVKKLKGENLQVMGVQADVSKESECALLMEKTLQAYQRLDILVNNAGTVKVIPLVEETEEGWQRVVDSILKSTFFCSRGAARVMIKQQYGRIVNIGSRVVLGKAGRGGYTAAKAGVTGLTRTLALELAPYRVTVNCVAPGFIDTALTRFSTPEGSPERTKLVSGIPLGRVGKPEDVAYAVLFLASDEASWITGQTLFVCGGLTVGAAPF